MLLSSFLSYQFWFDFWLQEDKAFLFLDKKTTFLINNFDLIMTDLKRHSLQIIFLDWFE